MQQFSKEEIEKLKQKPSIEIYKNLFDGIFELSKEQAGEILFAIIDFENQKEPVFSNPLLKAVFSSIKNHLLEKQKMYLKRCKINEQNGSKGGRPRETEENQEKPNETESVILGSSENRMGSNINININRNTDINIKENINEINNNIINLDLDLKEILETKFNEFEESFVKKEYQNFLLYWTEKNQKGKMKWQLEKTFEPKRRFLKWLENTKKWDKNKDENKRVLEL